MMNKYAWRNTVTATVSTQHGSHRGKIAFKTKDLTWVNTIHPVVVLVSVHSRFHDQVSGELKMCALMKTLKDYVRGTVTVLIADKAHLQSTSLNHGGSCDVALRHVLQLSDHLVTRYDNYFRGYNVVFWHSYISRDSHYAPCLAFVRSLYALDIRFRQIIHRDAETSMAFHSGDEISKDIILEKAIDDLIEQCAGLMVLSRKGYRFQFYPGAPYGCTEYINGHLDEGCRLSWINVFLSIEHKAAEHSYATSTCSTR